MAERRHNSAALHNKAASLGKNQLILLFFNHLHLASLQRGQTFDFCSAEYRHSSAALHLILILHTHLHSSSTASMCRMTSHTNLQPWTALHNCALAAAQQALPPTVDAQCWPSPAAVCTCPAHHTTSCKHRICQCRAFTKIAVAGVYDALMQQTTYSCEVAATMFQSQRVSEKMLLACGHVAYFPTGCYHTQTTVPAPALKALQPSAALYRPPLLLSAHAQRITPPETNTGHSSLPNTGCSLTSYSQPTQSTASSSTHLHLHRRLSSHQPHCIAFAYCYLHMPSLLFRDCCIAVGAAAIRRAATSSCCCWLALHKTKQDRQAGSGALSSGQRAIGSTLHNSSMFQDCCIAVGAAAIQLQATCSCCWCCWLALRSIQQALSMAGTGLCGTVHAILLSATAAEPALVTSILEMVARSSA
jgi:hypothetical protein